MAPEIIRKVGYTFGADVWACGIILYKLMAGVFPFRGNSEKDLFRKITIGKIEYPTFFGS
jgi:MAP/microtubule affinity-regulating kinase